MNKKELLLSLEFGFCFGPIALFWLWGFSDIVSIINNMEIDLLLFIVSGLIGLIGAISIYTSIIKKRSYFLPTVISIVFSAVGVISILFWLVLNKIGLSIESFIIFYLPIIGVLHLSYESRQIIFAANKSLKHGTPPVGDAP